MALGDSRMSTIHLEKLVNKSIDSQLKKEAPFHSANRVPEGFVSNVAFVKSFMKAESAGQDYNQKDGIGVMVPLSQIGLYEKILECEKKIAYESQQFTMGDSMLKWIDFIPFRLRKEKPALFSKYMRETLKSNSNHEVLIVKGLRVNILEQCYKSIVYRCKQIKWMEPMRSNRINGKCKIFFHKDNTESVIRFVDNQMKFTIEAELCYKRAPMGRSNTIEFKRNTMAKMDPAMLQRFEYGAQLFEDLSPEDLLIPGVTMSKPKQTKTTRKHKSFLSVLTGGEGGSKDNTKASFLGVQQTLASHGIVTQESIEERMKRVKEELEALIRNIEDELKAFGAQMNATDKTIMEKQGLVESVQASVTSVNSKVENGFARLDASIAAQGKIIAAQGKNIETLLASVETLTAFMTKVDEFMRGETKKRTVDDSTLTPEKNEPPKRSETSPDGSRNLEDEFSNAVASRQLDMESAVEPGGQLEMASEVEPGGFNGEPSQQ